MCKNKHNNVVGISSKGELFFNPHTKSVMKKDMLIIGTKGEGKEIKYDENGNRYVNGKLNNH
ncbi:TPA: hypothetical protein PP025_002743 [Staphylococcus aureus]|nr:hypothetical protein [Staphylococcus aureus]HDJ2457111.1 hypothetical protein [Staphylococcus aureus]HDJ2561322.1 hypothetical protein [Staphylococcus aureus]HDJ2707920.1 hypothetical protein [Staphylococcus aureus]